MPVSWTFLNPTTLVTKMKRFNFPELEIFDEWMKSVSVNFFWNCLLCPHKVFFNGFFLSFQTLKLSWTKIDVNRSNSWVVLLLPPENKCGCYEDETTLSRNVCDIWAVVAHWVGSCKKHQKIDFTKFSFQYLQSKQTFQNCVIVIFCQIWVARISILMYFWHSGMIKFRFFGNFDSSEFQFLSILNLVFENCFYLWYCFIKST